MGSRNYLIEGVSCSGKTTVCNALSKRGYHAINGDTELAYQGDPLTGLPLAGVTHAHHIWDVEAVRRIVADRAERVTFFCGGSRNFDLFIDLFDAVFALNIDRATLEQRLSLRVGSEWGATEAERDMIRALHASQSDLPSQAIRVDASLPVSDVVTAILGACDSDFV